MPELTLHRTNPAPPPMVCMYCGAPATSTVEWQEENRKPGPHPGGGGGGTDLSAAPTGDDPISGIIAVIMLPVVLWELLKGFVAGIGAVAAWLNRPRSAPVTPPKPEPLRTMRVVVTTCERHRRFRDRFVWAGAAGAGAVVGLWVWAALETRRVMGTEEVGLAVVLMVGAVFATVLVPLGLSAWYAFGGPVTADRTTEDTVVLDRVRRAYFDAIGRKPADAA